MSGTTQDRATDRVDEHVRDLVAHCRLGLVDEDQARRSILAALYSEGILEEAVRAYRVPEWLRDDVTDAVTEVLAAKVIQSTDPAFDLDRAATGSACGWFRTAAQHAVRWKVRDLRHAVATVTPSSETVELSGATYDMEDHFPTAALDREAAAVERFTAGRHRLRKTARERHMAAGVRETLSVPAGVRPAAVADREAIRALLGDDGTAAKESVARSLAVHGLLTDGTPTTPVASPGDQLASLWDDFTASQLLRLVSADPRLSHLLAVDAVADRPLPPQKQQAKLRASLTAAGPSGRAWQNLCLDLVHAWLATECEPASQYGTTPDSTHTVSAPVRQARLDTLLHRAAAWDTQPLGCTADDVQETVSSLAGALFGP